MLQTVPSRQTLARKYQQIVVIIQLQHAVEVVMLRREDTLTTSSMFLKFMRPEAVAWDKYIKSWSETCSDTQTTTPCSSQILLTCMPELYQISR